MSDDAPTETTGSAQVDAVLSDASAVEGLPVAEHAAVYEQAHQQLRHALDAD